MCSYLFLYKEVTQIWGGGAVGEKEQQGQWKLARLNNKWGQDFSLNIFVKNFGTHVNILPVVNIHIKWAQDVEL